MEKLYVVGQGPGGAAPLAGTAGEAINKSRRVLNSRETPLPDLLRELKRAGMGDTAVLVSGDCGFFSIAKTIVRDYSALYDIELIPGISSVSYLSAKIKTAYDDAVCVSLHGRAVDIVGKTAYNRKIFALTGGENSVRAICGRLDRCGLGGVRVTVGERLSFPDERIISGTAAEFSSMDFDDLSVMYIENPDAADPRAPLGDGDFIRGGVPMTKEDIRWLSIRKLGVMPGDIVYDIGAGTGSVSVELARAAVDGFVYAIETKEEACDLIRQNAARHGAYNMEIVRGKAPEAMSGLSAPDKAFIGGSSGNMDGIVGALLSMNRSVKIVANAVTLQTLNQVTESYKIRGLTDVEIMCVNIAKTKKAGAYDMMTAQNPVYIISGAGDPAIAAGENAYE